MRRILFIIPLLITSVCFGQIDLGGKIQVTRLYIKDSTRALPGTKALRINMSTGEVSAWDTTLTSSASLTSTYIGYGNGSNILTGTSDLIRNTSGEVILNASDKGAFKFQLEGNMYLGNATGSQTSTPEQFNMGGTVSDDPTAASKLKLQLYNGGGGSISGIGVGNDGSDRVMSYMVDVAGGRHDFFVNGTRRAFINAGGLAFPYSGAVINFNSSNAVITHSSGLLTSSVDFVVPDEAYDATAWNGSTEVPTKNAIRDKIESLSGAPSFSKSAFDYLPTSADTIDVWQTPVAITVTSIVAILRGTSSPSVTYNIGFGTNIQSPTAVFSSAITCTSITTGCTNSSGFNDATIPAGSFIWIYTTAASGTIRSIGFTINYTED